MSQMQINTTKTLIGTRGSALSRMATGDTSENEQRIHTPESILRPVRELFGGRIHCDPCGSPDSLVDAEITFGPEFDVQDCKHVAWPNQSFINPPYNDLKDIFSHGMKYDEQVWLIPVRTHRKWWRAARRATDAYVDMDPIAFVGFEQNFPAALALFYRGRDPFAFADLCGHLGELTFNDRVELADQIPAGPQGDLFA